MDRPFSRSRRGTLVGEMVAGHELLNVLAAGGMGEVYLARHVALGMVRAVKVIKPGLLGRDRSRERFEREAQVLARLQHNSIVQIIEFGTLANGSPFLAMEYIDGPGLDQLTFDAPLPAADALVVLGQIAGALHYAHSKGVIHRDLKPSNILVRGQDLRQVKIIDFGLARLIDTDAAKRLTGDGQPIGSPAYMAPEQVGTERDVTAAADVYALAGIAYTIISGEPPFTYRAPIKLMSAQCRETPPNLRSRCPAVPEFLDSLLLACLAKDPASRPRCDELAAHFERLSRAEPAAGAPRATLPRVELVPSPWTGRRNIAAELLDTPTPHEAGDAALALVTKIMSMIEEIASYLSTSDPELVSLLRLEASIREQLETLRQQLDLDTAHPAHATRAEILVLDKQRIAIIESMRTLDVQQQPLQRRMVEVVEAHRRYATGQIKVLFDKIDDALDELALLRGARS